MNLKIRSFVYLKVRQVFEEKKKNGKDCLSIFNRLQIKVECFLSTMYLKK